MEERTIKEQYFRTVYTDSLIILHSFNGVDGDKPHGSVIEIDNILKPNSFSGFILSLFPFLFA